MSQITTVLPKSDWERVTVRENNEPLVRVEASDKLITSLKDSSQLVRKSVKEKLIQASELLPENFKLKLIQGYRTLEEQQECWDKETLKIKLVHPELTDEEIESRVKMVVARVQPLANHHCGGAVDVTLVNLDGSEVNLGSPYISESKEFDRINFPMFSNLITGERAENRKVLREAMEKVGFVWYPGEWWHFCYGDRMWAVYTNQNECQYGPIEI